MANVDEHKKNQPELLVDFNGNAVQAWVLGGKTISVQAGGSFIAETTLIRIFNEGRGTARIKLKGADYASIPSRNEGSDVGFPIAPNTSKIFAVMERGQEYIVEGDTLDITFFYDRRTKIK